MCTLRATQGKTYKVKWNMQGRQDKRSFNVSELPERAAELGGMRGQRAERKHTTQTKASSAAAPLKYRQRGTCSRFSPLACFLSLSAVADITSLFPPVVVILRDLTSFVSLIERCRRVFLPIHFRFVSNLRLDCETTTHC